MTFSLPMIQVCASNHEQVPPFPPFFPIDSVMNCQKECINIFAVPLENGIIFLLSSWFDLSIMLSSPMTIPFIVGRRIVYSNSSLQPVFWELITHQKTDRVLNILICQVDVFFPSPPLVTLPFFSKNLPFQRRCREVALSLSQWEEVLLLCLFCSFDA